MGTAVKEFKENAETLEEGLSNSVYASEDRVLKVYTYFPFTSIYATFLEIVNGDITYISRNDRMNVEEEIVEIIWDSGFRCPEILERADNYIIFERVPGKSGYEHLNTCTPQEAEEFGEKVRDFLENLHEHGTALRDSRVSNFIVDGNEVYSIDHEYASLEAGRFFSFIDELTVTSSARQTVRYLEFVHGFQPGTFIRILSVFMAIYHTVFFERSLTRLNRIFGSLESDLQER